MHYPPIVFCRSQVVRKENRSSDPEKNKLSNEVIKGMNPDEGRNVGKGELGRKVFSETESPFWRETVFENWVHMLPVSQCTYPVHVLTDRRRELVDGCVCVCVCVRVGSVLGLLCAGLFTHQHVCLSAHIFMFLCFYLVPPLLPPLLPPLPDGLFSFNKATHGQRRILHQLRRHRFIHLFSQRTWWTPSSSSPGLSASVWTAWTCPSCTTTPTALTWSIWPH